MSEFYSDNDTGLTFRLESRGSNWVRIKLNEDSYWFTSAEFQRHFSPVRKPKSRLH